MIEKALKFIEEKYEGKVDANGELLTKHMIKVMEKTKEIYKNLYKKDAPEDTLVGALFHDILDDGMSDIFVILMEFGTRVAMMCSALQRKHERKKNWTYERYIESLVFQKQLDVHIIKLAELEEVQNRSKDEEKARTFILSFI